jgi:lysylphosphatidylglycerol synthetase-like protein (DUF2156 family)
VASLIPFSLFVPVKLVQNYRIKFQIFKNQQNAPVKVLKFTAFFFAQKPLWLFNKRGSSVGGVVAAMCSYNSWCIIWGFIILRRSNFMMEVRVKSAWHTCLIYRPLLLINSLMKRLRWSRGGVLAFGTQVRGFKPGRNRRTFRAKKSSARLPSEGK